MLNALGQVLPYVLGLIAAPIPIMAVVVLLMAPGGMGKAWLFVLAWTATVVVVATAVGLIAAEGEETAPGESPTWVAWTQLLLGALLLLSAVHRLRSRLVRPPEDEPAPPSWMAAIDSMGLGKIVGLAGLMAVVNPKSLAMVLGGGAAVAAFDLGPLATAGTAAVFAGLGAVGLLVPVVAAAVSGPRATASLTKARAWLVANSDTVTMSVLFVFGGVFAAKGFDGLVG